MWPCKTITAMTLGLDSADLEEMTLGVPHHQVREAPSAVPEVRSQAPAHTAEEWAPQAGDEILSAKEGQLVATLWHSQGTAWGSRALAGTPSGQLWVP